MSETGRRHGAATDVNEGNRAKRPPKYRALCLVLGFWMVRGMPMSSTLADRFGNEFPRLWKRPDWRIMYNNSSLVM